jgi:hypothetical protein
MIPSQPARATASWNSNGHRAALSASSQYESGKLEQIFAMASRTVDCESL